MKAIGLAIVVADALSLAGLAAALAVESATRYVLAPAGKRINCD